MDFKHHLETAWRLTIKFILPLVFMTLLWLAVSIITLGILAPATFAGYVRSILYMLRRGREPKLQDIFSQMDLLLPLLGFGLVVVLLCAVGFLLFVLPGILLTLGISFICLYMIPLMVDRGLGVVDAVKLSAAMTTQENVVEHLIVLIIIWAVTAIGSSFLIATLVTQPFAAIFLVSVYEEKFGGRQSVRTTV
jgi:uncharacterized membrane protein